MNKEILRTQYGYVTENAELNIFFAYIYGVSLYDGIPEITAFETRINYRTGLFQQWGPTGYHVYYFSGYIGRENALEKIKKEIKFYE